jgi:hypothetical protein
MDIDGMRGLVSDHSSWRETTSATGTKLFFAAAECVRLLADFGLKSGPECWTIHAGNVIQIGVLRELAGLPQNQVSSRKR